jgi:imidazoleglycerol-phosphate dehydratase
VKREESFFTHHVSRITPSGVTMNRQTTIQRQTSETDITVSLNLDGTGQHEISTGVGFLDHMLTAVAVHGLFDLQVKAVGDLHIDSHHTIEDCAIVLGQALDRTAGDRQGIQRVGHAYVPMDEALAFVAVDFSGRPHTVFSAEWATSASSPPTWCSTSLRAWPSMLA